jgi:DNA-binding XRE family transcriptional regulator
MAHDKHPLAEWRENQPEPLTQEDLRVKLGVGRWTINSIEKGRRKPSITLARKIEDLTGIKRQELRPDLFEGVR